MTDPRPRPQYGEYAPITPATEVPEVEAVTPDPVPPVEAPPAKRFSRDLIITSALLVIGVWDVVTGFAQYANLSVLIQQAYDQLGIGEFTSTEFADSMGGIITIGRVVILLIAIVLSLWRISKGKLSFWIPLTGAVVAAVFVGVCSVIVMTSDPAFIAFSQGMGG